MAAVTIPGVDVVLLDEQRKVLAGIAPQHLTVEQREALEGVQNMLDDWSDNNQEVINYHKAKR